MLNVEQIVPIDISHHKTLEREFVTDLYKKNNLLIENTFDVEVELNFQEYLSHAKQTDEAEQNIQLLLEKGLNDEDISTKFVIKENELFFKRNVFLILGKKQ